MTFPQKPYKLMLLTGILLLAALHITGCGTSQPASAQKNSPSELGEEACKPGGKPADADNSAKANSNLTSSGEDQKDPGRMTAKGASSSDEQKEEATVENDGAPSDAGVGYISHPGLAPQPSDEFPEYLEATAGLFAYYSQTDERWANSLFGPRDPILTHGCGPTVLAMLVSSYTSNRLDPLTAAAWAAQNGYCIPGDGSSHAIIEGGCKAFGLSAEPISRQPADLLHALSMGKVVVALMGKGYFTDSGHFIIIIQALHDGRVRIADPASLEHSQADWTVDFLISQLKDRAYNGGPLWAVGYPE